MTEQTKKTRKKEVKNNAGGYVYQIDDWSRLRRYLVMGSNSTFYTDAFAATMENAQVVLRCLEANPAKTIAEIEAVSVAGLGKSNSPCLFALAIASANKDSDVSGPALGKLIKVARTGSHLLEFVSYVDKMRGWGRSLRDAVATWYSAQKPDVVAYQVVKYKNRFGWSHKDVFRKAHPTASSLSGGLPRLFRWIVVGSDFRDRPVIREHDGVIYPRMYNKIPATSNYPDICFAVDQLKTVDATEAAMLIAHHNIPREAVPTELLNAPEIWEALLKNMPATALVRNLGKIAVVGVSYLAKEKIIANLTSEEYISRSLIHPLQILQAVKVYEQGHGDLGSLVWTPSNDILAALEIAYGLSFKNVVPTGKKIHLGLDVSGSMAGSPAGGSSLTAIEAEAAMAVFLSKTEPNVTIGLFRHEYTPFTILPGESIGDVGRRAMSDGFGGTDCALPILKALESGEFQDAFIIITDNETWQGNTKVSEALKKYRAKINPEARMIVMATSATSFSIADPDDHLSLDMAGFSADAFSVALGFIAGKY